MLSFVLVLVFIVVVFISSRIYKKNRKKNLNEWIYFLNSMYKELSVCMDDSTENATSVFNIGNNEELKSFTYSALVNHMESISRCIDTLQFLNSKINDEVKK